jgi:DNA replication protein DnaC
MLSNLKCVVPQRYQKSSLDDFPKELLSVVEGVIRKKKSLYIHGECGVGKTHLAYSILRRFCEKYPHEKKVLYNSVTSMLDELRTDSLENKDVSEDSLLDELSKFDGYLILDDIGVEKVTEFSANAIYKIINTRYESESPTIIISNLSLGELTEKYGDRIVSRIMGLCTVVRMEGDDRRFLDKK